MELSLQDFCIDTQETEEQIYKCEIQMSSKGNSLEKQNYVECTNILLQMAMQKNKNKQDLQNISRLVDLSFRKILQVLEYYSQKPKQRFIFQKQNKDYQQQQTPIAFGNMLIDKNGTLVKQTKLNTKKVVMQELNKTPRNYLDKIKHDTQQKIMSLNTYVITNQLKQVNEYFEHCKNNVNTFLLDQRKKVDQTWRKSKQGYQPTMSLMQKWKHNLQTQLQELRVKMSLLQKECHRLAEENKKLKQQIQMSIKTMSDYGVQTTIVYDYKIYDLNQQQKRINQESRRLFQLIINYEEMMKTHGGEFDSSEFRKAKQQMQATIQTIKKLESQSNIIKQENQSQKLMRQKQQTQNNKQEVPLQIFKEFRDMPAFQKQMYNTAISKFLGIIKKMSNESQLQEMLVKIISGQNKVELKMNKNMFMDLKQQDKMDNYELLKRRMSKIPEFSLEKIQQNIQNFKKKGERSSVGSSPGGLLGNKQSITKKYLNIQQIIPQFSPSPSPINIVSDVSTLKKHGSTTNYRKSNSKQKFTKSYQHSPSETQQTYNENPFKTHSINTNQNVIYDKKNSIQKTKQTPRKQKSKLIENRQQSLKSRTSKNKAQYSKKTSLMKFEEEIQRSPSKNSIKMVPGFMLKQKLQDICEVVQLEVKKQNISQSKHNIIVNPDLTLYNCLNNKGEPFLYKPKYLSHENMQKIEQNQQKRSLANFSTQTEPHLYICMKCQGVERKKRSILNKQPKQVKNDFNDKNTNTRNKSSRQEDALSKSKQVRIIKPNPILSMKQDAEKKQIKISSMLVSKKLKEIIDKKKDVFYPENKSFDFTAPDFSLNTTTNFSTPTRKLSPMPKPIKNQIRISESIQAKKQNARHNPQYFQIRKSLKNNYHENSVEKSFQNFLQESMDWSNLPLQLRNSLSGDSRSQHFDGQSMICRFQRAHQALCKQKNCNHLARFYAFLRKMQKQQVPKKSTLSLKTLKIQQIQHQ